MDAALRSAGFEVVPLDWAEFETGTNCFTTIFFTEAWDADHELVEANPDGVGADIVQTLDLTDLFRPGLTEARRQLAEWRRSLLALFDRVELLALPTLPIFPPRLEDLNPETFVPIITEITRHTSLFNAAGTPCVAQPIPCPGSRLPASLQLVGPLRGEELLLTTALEIEAATGPGT